MRGYDELQSVPNIGPVTAAAFVAALDDAHRFGRAHEVEAYVGLVPREWSSGETQQRGRITKAGSGRVRWLLIQAAVSTPRLPDPRTAELREWAGTDCRPTGKKIAVVALARRLAGILFALLRDETGYTPRTGGPPPPGPAQSKRGVRPPPALPSPRAPLPLPSTPHLPYARFPLGRRHPLADP